MSGPKVREVAEALHVGLTGIRDAIAAMAGSNPLELARLEHVEAEVRELWRLYESGGPRAVTPSRWQLLARGIEAAADAPPAGWEITRSLVPDGWRATWRSTGGSVQVIVGRGYCGEVVPEEQRLGTVHGDGGPAPTVEQLESALGLRPADPA